MPPEKLLMLAKKARQGPAFVHKLTDYSKARPASALRATAGEGETR